MIGITILASPGGGAVLHIQGHCGWSAFDLDRAQAVAVRDAFNAALAEPEPQTLDDLIRAVS